MHRKRLAPARLQQSNSLDPPISLLLPPIRR